MTDSQDRQAERLLEAFRPQVVAEQVRGPEFATLTQRAVRRKRQRTQRLVAVAAVIGVVALGVPAAVRGWLPVLVNPAGDPADFPADAQVVADAYTRSGLAFVRSYGLVPVQELTTLTAESTEKPGSFNVEDTFVTEAQYQAFLAGRFAMDPALVPDEGGAEQVTLPDGSTVEAPTVGPYTAFEAMQQSEPAPDCQGDQCVVLTITQAAVGTVPIAVEGGTAEVPAWLFTIDGLKAPIARVALAADGSLTQGLKTVAELLPERTDGLWSTRVERIELADGDATTARTLTLHFTGGVCDEDRVGAVFETPQLIVVGVNISSRGESCVLLGEAASVQVLLLDPLARRVVVGVDGVPISAGS
jgi:hypothetical protein